MLRQHCMKIFLAFSALVLLVSSLGEQPALAASLLLPTATAARTRTPTRTHIPTLTRTATPSRTPTVTPTPLPTSTNTPAPKAGAEPLAWLDASIHLDQFLPKGKLVIHFNTPMDPGSSPNPVLAWPTLEGTASWNDAHTSLTFQLKTVLKSSTTYTFFLDPALRSADGKALQDAPDWVARPQSGPKILKVMPGEGALFHPYSLIEVYFNREMQTAAPDPSLFTIQPAIPAELAWKTDKRTLQIKLQEPLQADQRYDLTLRGGRDDLGLFAADGSYLAEDYRWFYWLAPLQATTKLVNPRLLEVSFNYTFDQTKSGLPLTISPALRGEWKWATSSKLSFNASEPIPASREYTLALSSPLVSADGLSFETLPKTTFIGLAPIQLAGRGIQKGSYSSDLYADEKLAAIQLEFDLPVEHASAEQAFSLSPAVPGKFRWEKNAKGDKDLLVYELAELLQVRTAYIIEIGVGVKSVSGEPLILQPWRQEFFSSYQGRNVFGEEGANIQVLDASGPRQLEFSGVKEAVNFVAYPFELIDFARLYGEHGQAPRYSGVRDIPIPADLKPAVAWSATSIKTYQSGSDKYSVNVTTVPGDLPPGLYVVNARAENILLDQLFVVITRNTLVVKRSDSEIFAWVSDINGNRSIQAEIRVYTASGEKIREGQTDENGQYRVNLPSDLEPLLVAARVREPGQPDDITLAGLDYDWLEQYPYWYDDPAYYYPDGQANLIYLYPERPLYKPGQTVNFKAIVRQDRDVRYSLPEVGTPVTVLALDPRGNTVETFELQTNRFGTVNGSFQLSEGAMLGDYTLQCQLADSVFSETFKVADYRKPDYQVTLTSLQPEKANRFVRGEEVKVQVHVGYYFGEPLAKTRLAIDFYQGDRKLETGVPGISGMITDEQGDATLIFKAPYNENDNYYYWWGAPAHQDLRLEVTVEDGSQQTVTGAYGFTVYPSALQLSLNADGYYHQPNQPFTVTARVVDLSEQPLAGQKLTLSTRRWDYKKFEFGKADQTFTLITEAQGQANQEIQLPPGYHLLTVSSKDEQGNANSVEHWVYVFKNQKDWLQRTQGTYLAVSTDKEFYKPYETARLAIESSFSGPALLSFERGSVINTKMIELTAPLTLIETEIIPEHAPNVFITVNAWQPAGDQSYRDNYYGGWWAETQADSYLRVAKIHVQVDASAKALEIQITPEKQVYAPGETLNATIQVRDATGKPVLAELSLAVVDEAIYALASEKEAIFAAFYGLRGHSVSTYDSMAPSRWLEVGGRGGGGGDFPPGLRTDFPDTSAWLPVIETDANGQARVSVKLPDNTTCWRLTVKAITLDHQVGQAKANVETKKEVFLRPVLPRILTNGDLATLTTFVHNYSDLAQTLTVSLEAPGLELLSPAETQVSVRAGEVLPVSWPARVTSAKPTEATFTVRGAQGDLDAIRLPLALQPAAVRDVQNQSGEFTGTLTLALPFPEVERETSQVRLSINRSHGGTLLNGLDYLIGYPYGCVEQTMSRALPNAVVGRAVDQLGLGGAGLEKRLPPLIRASLDHLYGLQHGNGGWGWWADDVSDHYQTAWVLFGLELIKEAGYDVEPNVIENGAEWLEYELTHADKLDPRTRAYALYSLALVGRGNLEQTQALVTASLYQLDPFSQASLALALNRLGEKNRARQVLDLLAQEAVKNGGQVYWPQPLGDGEYHAKSMSSTTRTTALVLLAYAEIDPQNELVAGIVQYLAAQRRGVSGWGTTNETSFTILALTEYLAAQESQAGSTPYEVLVNGQSLFTGTLEVGNPNASLDLPLDKLNPGVNTLLVKTEGDRPLYYDLSTSYDLLRSEVAAAGKISIKRRYLDPKTKLPLDLEKIQPGQLVKVELTVQIPDNAYYLAVEDYLPGGLEAINEGLSATVQISSEDYWGYYEDFTRYYWEDYGYNYKEIRGDRVVFFITSLGKGTRTFTYYARATTSGEFLALPAQAYAMYDLTLWGRSASAQLNILDK